MGARFADGQPLQSWAGPATRRRATLFALTAVQSYIACHFLLKILPDRGESGIEIAVTILFAILFGWISLGFWTAVAGFWVGLRGSDRFKITYLEDDPRHRGVPLARTAVVMPVCNEDTTRVFAGLRAIYRSLQATGEAGYFDFFILSDSSDPDVWVEEERAWAQWCRDEGDHEHIHYRRRRTNIKRKTGNIADFCRRWGSDYRYMIVLDADSVMSGNSMVRLVRLMERRRQVGIIQTAPLTVGRDSLYARIQQFSNQVYGPLFAAGLNFWQMGDGYYWGHNAIIRLAPFIEHCALERLPGKGAMGGEILSHDFVEAAFMRRAGWEVWLAYDMDGSYEETPPTLLDELKRDRRWSQGNLQHLRLLHTWGLRLIHRVMFLYGVMAYGSSLLWLALLALSTVAVFVSVNQPPVYFPDTPSLFPVWRVWRPEWALSLLGSTAVLLFLPKILGILAVAFDRRRRALFGGIRGLSLSLILETLFSALLAPVRMLFHSKYVALTLFGHQAGWGTQSRADTGTRWSEALYHHGPGTLLAVLWAGVVLWYVPQYLLWLSPIIAGLTLAIPLSVYSSRVGLGRAARRAGLFLIPAETAPPAEWSWVADIVGTEGVQGRQEGAWHGFALAVVDPRVNALHLAMLPSGISRPPRTARRLESLRHRALLQGPDILSPHEKRSLLYDPESIAWLHSRVWESQDDQVAQYWDLPTAA